MGQEGIGRGDYTSCAWGRKLIAPFSLLYAGMIHGLVTVAKNEKLAGLYRGISPTLLAIAPFMGVQQASYDALKHQAMLHNITPSPILFFACGSVAGATAQTVSDS